MCFHTHTKIRLCFFPLFLFVFSLPFPSLSLLTSLHSSSSSPANPSSLLFLSLQPQITKPPPPPLFIPFTLHSSHLHHSTFALTPAPQSLSFLPVLIRLSSLSLLRHLFTLALLFSQSENSYLDYQVCCGVCVDLDGSEHVYLLVNA
ncbi:MAG: hypothetical protein JOS17DRAFT_341980 [Linnemannia elongata]|nr:MAG: hypothetical protein JOS17DRAFT_341980 [Linnemannia elongata]